MEGRKEGRKEEGRRKKKKKKKKDGWMERRKEGERSYFGCFSASAIRSESGSLARMTVLSAALAVFIARS